MICESGIGGKKNELVILVTTSGDFWNAIYVDAPPTQAGFSYKLKITCSVVAWKTRLEMLLCKRLGGQQDSVS